MAGIGSVFRSLWARVRDSDSTDSGYSSASPYSTVDQLAIVQGACSLYGRTMAGASPGAPLTPAILQYVGWWLGMRGQATLLIDIEDDGRVVLHPFAAHSAGGHWVGQTIETAGRPPRNMRGAGW